MTEPGDVRLKLVNRAENVALVRQAITGLAATIHLEDGTLSDIRTAVSEACNNVVLHAYDGEDGLLEVWAHTDDEDLIITVRDEGGGIQPRAGPQGSAMQGVGLALIQTLTDRVEFSGGDSGTEVRMTFSTGQPLDTGAAPCQTDIKRTPGGEVVVLTCGLLVGPVLSGVVGMLAARADFSVERLADAQLVTDAIAAHGPLAFPGRYVIVAMDVDTGVLDLRLGPLREGGAETLLEASAVEGIGPLLERLTDEQSVEGDGEGDVLRLSFRAAA